MGEQDYASYEWARIFFRVDTFQGFQHVRDQAAAVKFVRQLPPDAVVTCYYEPFSLRYLAHRPILKMNHYVEEQGSHPGRLFLVLTPVVGLLEHLPPDAYRWIEEHCQLQAQFGRYSIYEVPVELIQDAPNKLHSEYGEYSRHPLSRAWLGRSSAPENP